MISSASTTVESRCAMTSVVRFARHAVERVLDFLLGVGVERRGRLVEHQDRRVLQDGAGDGDALLLAAGEFQAALADHRSRSRAAARDEVVDLGDAAPLPRPRLRSRRCGHSAML